MFRYVTFKLFTTCSNIVGSANINQSIVLTLCLNTIKQNVISHERRFNFICFTKYKHLLQYTVPTQLVSFINAIYILTEAKNFIVFTTCLGFFVFVF